MLLFRTVQKSLPQGLKLFGSVHTNQKRSVQLLRLGSKFGLPKICDHRETEKMIFRQLFDRESCTYTYLLGDKGTKEALLIDPVDTLVERDIGVVEELGLTLKYALNTHVHADHITGTCLLKKHFKDCKSVLGAEGNEKAKADIKVSEKDSITVGKIKLNVLSTPGHTNGCHTYVCEMDGQRMVFTGDLILVRGCGRTDFQQGDSEKLYRSVHDKIFTMPDETLIYSAHDYKGHTRSTVGEEKRFNPRLSKPLKEFQDIMANLNLSYPKMIDKAVPANLLCGLQE